MKKVFPYRHKRLLAVGCEKAISCRLLAVGEEAFGWGRLLAVGYWQGKAVGGFLLIAKG